MNFKICCAKKIFIAALLCWLVLCNLRAYATSKTIIDIYRTNQITANEICNKFGEEISQMVELKASPEGLSNDKNSEQFNALVEKINHGIENMGDFLYVKASIITYPGDDVIHMTVDIVDRKDKQRLKYFLPKPTESIPDPDNLLATWSTYEKSGWDIAFKEKKFPEFKSCPVHHCIFGFEHPKLKEYEEIFNNLVSKNKTQLAAILKNDKDDQKRASAAFLLAHIKDGKELAAILVPSMRDPNSLVRNNVMRVLGATLDKIDALDFPVDEAITALDFPRETDRNKALYILFSLAKQPKYAQYIAQHAGNLLIDELKMFQPNLHNFAYATLKEISGKSYGERDYSAWQTWVDEVKVKNAVALIYRK
jgi:hypothetical protein